MIMARLEQSQGVFQFRTVYKNAFFGKYDDRFIIFVINLYLIGSSLSVLR